MREIIPRTAVGAETASMLSSSSTEATGIKNKPAKEEEKPGTTSGTAVAILAIGIGGALIYMQRSRRAGFQVDTDEGYRVEGYHGKRYDLGCFKVRKDALDAAERFNAERMGKGPHGPVSQVTFGKC
jgi:hypothetical protein